ncbi:hypothetical protein OROMI_026907 [Orobanche minor]
MARKSNSNYPSTNTPPPVPRNSSSSVYFGNSGPRITIRKLTIFVESKDLLFHPSSPSPRPFIKASIKQIVIPVKPTSITPAERKGSWPSDFLNRILQAAKEAFLKRKDLIGLARTGSGKTGAFVIPIPQSLLEYPQQAFYACVLSPTGNLRSRLLSCFKIPVHCGIYKEIGLQLSRYLIWLPKWRSPRAAVEMHIQEVSWRGIHTQIVVAATPCFWKVSEISRCLLDDSKCTEQVAAKIQFGRSYQIRWCRALENVEVLADKDDATPENVEVPADDE